MFSHISASSSSSSIITATALCCKLRSSLFPSSSKLFRPNFHFYPSFPSILRKRHSNFSLRASMDSSSSSTTAVDSVADDLRNQSLESNDAAGNKNDSYCTSTRPKLKLEELNWDHSFVRELPGDPRTDVMSREVF